MKNEELRNLISLCPKTVRKFLEGKEKELNDFADENDKNERIETLTQQISDVPKLQAELEELTKAQRD